MVRILANTWGTPRTERGRYGPVARFIDDLLGRAFAVAGVVANRHRLTGRGESRLARNDLAMVLPKSDLARTVFVSFE